MMNWHATSRLHRAIGTEIAALEGDIKLLDVRLATDKSERALAYWKTEMDAVVEAIGQLRDLANIIDTDKWASIKGAK